MYSVHITDPLLDLPLEDREKSGWAVVFGEGIEVEGQRIVPLLVAMVGAVEAVVKVYQDAGLLR